MEFKEGDLVRLKSGGPVMTVEELYDEDLSCVWFEKVGNKQVMQRGSFRPSVLDKAQKPGIASMRVIRA
jgi:uncharacterized protein YodC (DUF2158 family)